MRPIQLQLAGLHSYRELQVIDFEALCEAGLFGIFGPTGSGKSTILDAITLALYGQVVRLGGDRHPQQVLNQLEERCFVSFTFELGEGIQRKRYTIEREISLDKKGNKRQPEVRLIERSLTPGIADQVLESKATSATAMVEQLIGLTIQDFTRAVVLPQGQFSRFLTLKGSERNEMLQRIFQLHEYGEKLNERVRNAMEQNKAELHQLEVQLAALGDVGPEAMQAASEELKQAEQQAAGLDKEWQTLQAQQRQSEQIRTWQKELAKVSEKWEQLQAEQEEIEQLQEKIGFIERSVAIWPQLEKYQLLQEKWSETEAKQKQLQDLLVQLEQEQRSAEQTYQTVQQQVREREPQLLEQKTQMSVALEWERELDALQHELVAISEQKQRLEAELQQAEEQLRAAAQQQRQMQAELTKLDEELQQSYVSAAERQHLQALLDAKKVWQQIHKQVLELQQEAEGMDRQHRQWTEQLQQQERSWQQAVGEWEQAKKELAQAEATPLSDEAALEEQRNILAAVRVIGKEWREVSRLQAVWQQKWQEWEKSWNQAKAREAAREAEWQAADTARLTAERNRLEAEYVREQWQEANMARLLRNHLREGEPCVVCGSLHHPHRQQQQPSDWTEDEHRHRQEEERLNHQCQQAIAALNQAEQAARQAYEQLHAAKVELAGLQQRKEGLLEEQKAIKDRADELRAELSRLGSEWQATDVDDLLQRYQQAESSLKQQLEQQEKRKGEREALRNRVNQLREKELNSKADRDQTKALLTQLEESRKTIHSRLEEMLAQEKQSEEQLHQLRADIAVEKIEETYDEMVERSRRYEQLQERQTQLNRQLAQQQTFYQQHQEKQSRLSFELHTVTERLAEKQAAWQNKRQQWQLLTGGVAAGERIRELEERLEQGRQQLAQAEQKRTKALEALQELQKNQLKTEESLHQLRVQLDEQERLLTQLLTESQLTKSEVVELVAEKSQLPDYRQRLEQFQTLRAQVEYEQQRLQELLQGRSVTDEEWEQLCAAAAEIEQSLAAARAQVAVTRDVLAKIEQNHDRWQQLQARYQVLADEQSRLEDLRKLFEGKAFVQFIAEEKLASIARDASYHLAQMTKNRYALEIGAEGEFVLRDEAAGGLRRPVATLSGGETFLTSLALALALSVEIQMRGGRLEFFFLDEGFGTLDPELLEVVLDALERLRVNQFTIGLISHVPELRVRMPRRLVITPAEPMGAGSKIRLERD